MTGDIETWEICDECDLTYPECGWCPEDCESETVEFCYEGRRECYD